MNAACFCTRKFVGWQQERRSCRRVTAPCPTGRTHSSPKDAVRKSSGGIVVNAACFCTRKFVGWQQERRSCRRVTAPCPTGRTHSIPEDVVRKSSGGIVVNAACFCTRKFVRVARGSRRHACRVCRGGSECVETEGCSLFASTADSCPFLKHVVRSVSTLYLQRVCFVI